MSTLSNYISQIFDLNLLNITTIFVHSYVYCCFKNHSIKSVFCDHRL